MTNPKKPAAVSLTIGTPVADTIEHYLTHAHANRAKTVADYHEALRIGACGGACGAAP